METIESLFKKFAGFFIDGQHAITKRLGVGLIVLGLAFIIDDQIGFSFYYASQQKIAQVEKLNAIIQKDSSDKIANNELKKLRLTVLRRKGLFSHLWDLTKATVNSRSAQTRSTSPTSIIDSRRNVVLHVLTSSWLLIIFSLLGIVGLLLQKRVGGNEIGVIVLLIIAVSGIAVIFSFLFSFIPIIAENVTYNYIVNTILHGLIMIMFFRLISKTAA